MDLRRFLFPGGALLLGFLLGIWLGSAAAPQPDPRCLALDASYEIDGVSVPLTDGVHVTRAVPDAQSALRTAVERMPVRGCLHRQGGRCCAAVILSRQAGGAGVYVYVVAAIGDHNKLGHGVIGTNAVYLGDRVEVLDMTIESEILTVRLFTHVEGSAPDQPPTEEIMRQFFLRGNELAEI